MSRHWRDGARHRGLRLQTPEERVVRHPGQGGSQAAQRQHQVVIPPVIIIPDNQHFTDWCVRMAGTGRPGGGCSWAVSTPASPSPTPRVPGCMLWPTLWAHISRWIDIINNTKNDAIIFISHARSPTASLTASCCPWSRGCGESTRFISSASAAPASCRPRRRDRTSEPEGVLQGCTR